jgi:hypothetical protein
MQWYLPVAGIIIITVVAIAILIALRSLSDQQAGEGGALTIASFEPSVSAALSNSLRINVSSHGVTGNTIYVIGTVSWVDPENNWGIKPVIALCANKPLTGNAVDVKLYLNKEYDWYNFYDNVTLTLGRWDNNFYSSQNFSLFITIA